MKSRSVWIAVFVGIIALGFIAAIVTAFVTDSGKSSASSTTTGASSASDTFDLPLGLESNTLALGKHQKDVLVGLAARPGGPVEVAVVHGDTPLSGDAVRVTVDGRVVPTESCGTGCTRVQSTVLQGRPSQVEVTAGPTPVSFQLPASLPASGQSALDRARGTMAALRSYRFTERLTSGGPTVLSRLVVQAPDRLSLKTNGGFRSVIIGHKRWDYIDGHWQEAPFPGLNAREVLMSTSFAGGNYAFPIFAVAKAKTGATFDERAYSARFDVTIPSTAPRIRTRKDPIRYSKHNFVPDFELPPIAK